MAINTFCSLSLLLSLSVSWNIVHTLVKVSTLNGWLLVYYIKNIRTADHRLWELKQGFDVIGGEGS